VPARGGEPLLEDIRSRIESIYAASDVDIAGIGICLAEIVNPSGTVRSDNLIQWKDLPVSKRLSDLGRVVVESDVRSPARAEAVYGAGRESDTFLYITVGTGIASCLVLGGRPFAGARGGALCLGSAPLVPGDPTLLEDVASGPAIVARYNARAKAVFTRAEEVLKRAASGDTNSSETVHHAATALGTGIGILANTLDPEIIVVGGGLGSADGLYWDVAVETVRESIWWEEAKTMPIVHAAFGADAGLIGAALGVVEGG